MRSEIVKDIDTWSETKLRTWFCDSVARYEMADVNRDHAVAYTMTTLMVMMAKVLATLDTTPEEAGQHLVESIRFVRRQ